MATRQFHFSKLIALAWKNVKPNYPILRADPVRFAAPMKVKLATKRKVPPKIDYETENPLLE